jgi:hypothetical protein
MAERAENILSLLTLDEKIAVLASTEVDRLGIPNPGRSEGIHQVVLKEGRSGGESVSTTSFLCLTTEHRGHREQRNTTPYKFFSVSSVLCGDYNIRNISNEYFENK